VDSAGGPPAGNDGLAAQVSAFGCDDLLQFIVILHLIGVIDRH
jgi:hypothetical protein